MKRLKYFVKERKFSLSLLLLLLLVVEIGKANAALTATIDVKSSFKSNETVFFTYTIVSDKDMKIKYIPLIVCENAPVPLLEEKTTNLKKDVPFTETYYGLTVNEAIEPQKCQAILEIVTPTKTKKFSKSFSIVTKPSFEVKILYWEASSRSKAKFSIPEFFTNSAVTEIKLLPPSRSVTLQFKAFSLASS